MSVLVVMLCFVAWCLVSVPVSLFAAAVLFGRGE